MSKTGKFHELTQAWKRAHTHMGEGERERPFLANQLVYNGQKHARHGSAHTHIREGEREPFLANQLVYNGQARGLSAKGHIINVSLPGIILNEADQGLFH